MAENNGRRNYDIPISKNRNNMNSANRQTNPYSYDELRRRQNGQTSVNSQQQQYSNRQARAVPRQQYASRQPSHPTDIFVDRSRNTQPQRKTYDDYRNEYQHTRQARPVQTNAVQQPPENKKPKKKKGCLLTSIIALLLVVVIGYSGITGYMFSIFSNVEYKKTESNASGYTESMDLEKSSSVENILLIGVDDKKGGTTSRSDTMILLSIDKKHRQLKMTSFMRDTYVSIPGHGENKLNAACAFGGPQLVMETIEYNFGIEIDNYVLVDFNAFKDVIDSLGGVTVEVEKKEAEYINRTSRQNIDYGEAVTLNGEEALVYVRIRYLDSDFNRTKRQRKVISAIIDSAKESDIADLIETGKTVLSYVETDISPLKLTFLAQGALLSYIRYDIVQSRVPFDKKYSSQTINGSYVIVVNKEETSELLKEFIFEKAETEEEIEK